MYSHIFLSLPWPYSASPGRRVHARDMIWRPEWDWGNHHEIYSRCDGSTDVFLSAFAVEYPVLTIASPDQVGFDSQKLHRLDGWIQNQIDAGYPSINLLVIKDNHIVLQKAWGYAKKYDGSTLLAHPIRATTNTMYDLASNTKMYATNFALQKLVYEGKIDVNDLVSKYIPGFKDMPGIK